jgi:hypothetical protein
VVHYSDLNLDKKQVIKRFDKYMFKDKKIVFVYEADKAGVPVGKNQVLESLEAYLRDNTSVDVAALILRMVGYGNSVP